MAFEPENLQQIESIYGFHYPSAFWERRKELVALAAVERFRQVFPSARLVGTHEEIRALRQAEPDLPNDFIPFMVTGDDPFPDYYGFEIPQRPDATMNVLVWCIHTYVHSWDNGFNEFLDEYMAGTDEAT